MGSEFGFLVIFNNLAQTQELGKLKTAITCRRNLFHLNDDCSKNCLPISLSIPIKFLQSMEIVRNLEEHLVCGIRGEL